MSSMIRATFAATLLVAATQAVFAADPTVSPTGAVPIPFCNTAYPECQEWQAFAQAANASTPSNANGPLHPPVAQSPSAQRWLMFCETLAEKYGHETPSQATRDCTAKLNAWLAANQQ